MQPTGDYAIECRIGHDYAVEFLKSCDGTVLWGTLLGEVVRDMIHAGPAGHWSDGAPKLNGIAVGFLGLMGTAVAGYVRLSHLNCEREGA